MTKLDKLGVKQFHLVCTFIIWCLFWFLIKCCGTSLDVVLILPFDWPITSNIFRAETSKYYMTKLEKNGYQTVPFSVYIHSLMFFFFSETSLGAVVILPLITIGQLQLTFSSLRQLILDQTEQNRYQTVPFIVYIHNLMFVFLFDQVFWN